MASDREIELIIRAMRLAKKESMSSSEIAQIMWDQGWKKQKWSDGPNPGAVGNIVRREGLYFQSVTNPTGRQGFWYSLTAYGKSVQLPLSGDKQKKTTRERSVTKYRTDDDRGYEFSEGGVIGRILVKNNNKNRRIAPDQPGVYFLHDEQGEVVYIGLSKSDAPTQGIRGRLNTHMRQDFSQERQFVKYNYFSYILIDTELTRTLEKFLVMSLDPSANINDRLPDRQKYLV